MSTPGANLPLVIQQAGDVSRVQEVTQRAGEVQQSSAAAEVAQQQEMERTGVPRTDPSVAENKVRTDAKERRRQREERRAARRKKKRRAQEDLPTDDSGGGLVDVII